MVYLLLGLRNLLLPDGVKLNAYIIKPNDFDSTKKYPVLFYNYSGPGSQMVVDRWMGLIIYGISF